MSIWKQGYIHHRQIEGYPISSSFSAYREPYKPEIIQLYDNNWQ